MMNERRPDLWLASEDDPWLEQVARLMGSQRARRSHRWRPPTDLVEKEDCFIVLVEVAGMKAADFDVTFDQQVLRVRGVRREVAEGKAAYHQMEISYGEFVTEVLIPAPVEKDQIRATYTDGFLRVVLPKTKPKTVSISISD